MTEDINKGINIEVDEDNTTRVPHDAFENAQLKFPCDFPISVMGLNVPEYKETIFAILKKHVPEVEAKDLKTSFSANKKYCSLKTHFTAQSREQMDELYKELTGNQLVKWVL
ncbi:MAG: DUF493 domain-containing protein [Anaerolineaceae bacterium]|nr:DUF493 domain-containing protein [Anaerolineaceae bacterium]